MKTLKELRALPLRPHTFTLPYYVNPMQTRDAEDEMSFFKFNGDREIREMQALANRVAVWHIRAAVGEVAKRLEGIDEYETLTITAEEFGQEVIDDLRALSDWVSAIGGGTIDDPDYVCSLPNMSRIGKRGFCRFCGTRGGSGSCCD
jgi:hypothetical protein